MILDDIIKEKRKSVAKRELERPIESFRETLTVSTRSLEQALRADKTCFICECKKASPSSGVIRKDYDPVQIAKTYEPFADAISVLTDTAFFQGDFEHLKRVSASVKIPVLCKDFIIAPYQVYEARFFGADAVLLMLSVLDDETYLQCADVALSLKLDVLTEIHTEDELKRALKLGAKIIGINNRNLKTMKIDLETTRKLVPHIPADRIIVCESGIENHHEIAKLRSLVDAFLVGSSLMRQPRMDLAIRALVFGRVKICGLTSPEDAHQAYALGATYGGLIFAKESPRAVSIQTAAQIVDEAPLRWVGVFVNEKKEMVSAIAQELHLSAVQLHGDEDADYISSLRQALPKTCEIWKAVRVQGHIPALDQFGADRLLLDSFSASMRGGTGKAWDWSALKAYRDRERIIISGGVSPSNCEDVDYLGAWAIDVNSKVEYAPGKKDRQLLAALFGNLRGKKRLQDIKS